MRRTVEWWFAISLALLYSSLALRFFLRVSEAFVFALGAAASTVLALVGLLVVLATVRSRRQLAVSLVALVALSLVPLSDRSGDWLYFWFFRSRLQAFVSEIRSYQKIHEMSDGTRHRVSLNGEVFLQTAAAENIERILGGDDVAEVQYQAFSQRLVDLGLIGVEVHEGFMAFLWGGMLDNLAGFLWVEPGASPPDDRYFLFESNLLYLKSLSGGWYRFGTS